MIKSLLHVNRLAWIAVLLALCVIAFGAFVRLSALYFIVGIVVILIRGLVTEWITKLLIKRGGHEARFAEFDEAYAAGHIQGGHE